MSNKFNIAERSYKYQTILRLNIHTIIIIVMRTLHSLINQNLQQTRTSHLN